MAEVKSELRSPSSSPSSTMDRRHSQDSRDAGYYTKPELPVKPVLAFSIERILGLNNNSYSVSNVSNQTTPREEVGYHGYRNHFTNLHGDDDYDDDDVDEEDEDEEKLKDIDVDDSMIRSDVSCNRDVLDYSKFNLDEDTPKYQWLQCTRYHPPKIQRSKKVVIKKRKLGRNPRVPFTQHQVSVLEEKFHRTHYLSSMDVAELSTALNLTETRVKIWFQNRRARERRDKETSHRHQTTVVNKATHFQPLTIPSVTWPISSPMNAGNYPGFDGPLNFRPGYLSSAFRLYSSTMGTEPTNTQISPQSHPTRHPSVSETSPIQLVTFK